jgi:hypothetical protein
VVKEKLPNVQPAVWVGMQRRWNLPGVPPEAALQADSRLTCFISATNSSDGVQLSLGADQNEPRSILARLGSGGVILDSVQAQGFNLYAGNQAYTKVLQIYPDGSQLVEEMIISSPVLPDVTFQLDVIVAGVIFDDGTTTRILSAADFDALGQCKVRFIRPSSAVTSVCHSYKAYQGAYQIGYRH